MTVRVELVEALCAKEVALRRAQDRPFDEFRANGKPMIVRAELVEALCVNEEALRRAQGERRLSIALRPFLVSRFKPFGLS
jgi:hypothetical protein